jgi:phosphoribosylformimino-5-aminoimidazole carboxamide ribotide isomerase
VEAVIIGKALYQGAINLRDALEITSEELEGQVC